MNWIQRLGLTTVAVVLLATVPVVGSRPTCPSACCNPDTGSKVEGGCCSKPVPAQSHTCCPDKAEPAAEGSCCPSESQADGPDSPCGCFVAGDELPLAVPPAVVPAPSTDWVYDLPHEVRVPPVPPVLDADRTLVSSDSSPPPAPLPPDAPRAPPAF